MPVSSFTGIDREPRDIWPDCVVGYWVTDRSSLAAGHRSRVVAHALACRPELVEGPRAPSAMSRGAHPPSRVILSPRSPVTRSLLPLVILSPQAKDLVPGRANRETGWAAAVNPHPQPLSRCAGEGSRSRCLAVEVWRRHGRCWSRTPAEAPLPRTGRGVGVRVLWRDAAVSGQYLPLPAAHRERGWG